MKPAPEDRFVSDLHPSGEQAARRRLHMLIYAGALIGGYGLLLETIVPIALALIRGTETFASVSLAWIPVAVLGVLLHRRMLKPALALAVAALIAQLFHLVSITVLRPHASGFALFSQIYYGAWAAGYFLAVIAGLARPEVRRAMR